MIKAVSEGRKREFAAFGFGEADVPDPEARETFDRSKLNWDEMQDGYHKEMHDWYKALIDLRRNSIWLNDGDKGHTRIQFSEENRWLVMDRGGVRVLANLGQKEASFEVPEKFQLTLASRDGVANGSGRVSLPPNTLAVISCESDS